MKYAIKTYGCKLNQSETDNLDKVLSKNFEKTTPSEADLVVFNSCGVIDKTERRVLKDVKELKKSGKTVIITGCLPSMTKKAKKVADLTVEGNNPDLFQNKLSQIYSIDKINKNNLPTIQRKGSSSIIIPISSGCLGNCTYCSAKIARGELESYSMDEITTRVRKALKQDIKEVQLTSQDLGIYGMDQGKPMLVELIRKLLNIEEDFKIKLGMMNPGFIDVFFNDFLELFKSDKLYKFLHLPVQSGDDQILKRMNRKHTTADFIKLVNLIRSRYNNFLISTDIIVGFPGETEEEFNKTIELIKETRPHIINITRYSERAGTKAAEFQDMPSKIKKERSRELTKLAKKIRIEDNEKMVGKNFEALIFREGKENTKLARIFNGKAVVLNKGEVGKKVNIKIIDFKHNYLIGENVQS
ncbi:MAG: tRNA (N(6)-L-threonylcarbamoyladenosine(37)-C(2))-methylthiotransferase [Patescibacteria group bacterium]